MKMLLRPLLYASSVVLMFFPWYSIHLEGGLTFISGIIFFLLPILDFILKPDYSNLSKEEEKQAASIWYSIVIYLLIPLFYFVFIDFLIMTSHEEFFSIELCGKIFSVGILVAINPILFGHELGHRKNKRDQFIGKALLIIPLYMHFYISHNRGHHKIVATPEDPGSARKHESLYAYWFRAITGAYKNAWDIENRRVLEKHGTIFTIQNEMIVFQVIQAIYIAVIWAVFGPLTLIAAIAAGFVGVLILITINYVEHYGLTRKMGKEGMYERYQPWHSWSSNHLGSRILLFEFPRHTDHHAKTFKEYQLLINHDGSPQLPTGYTGMMLLALIPNLWFKVMNRKVEEVFSAVAARTNNVTYKEVPQQV